jgi:arylsulfate sulfotransferase
LHLKKLATYSPFCTFKEKTMSLRLFSFFLATTFLFLVGCGTSYHIKKEEVPEEQLIVKITSTSNPEGIAPLTAFVEVETKMETAVSLKIHGAIPIDHQFEKIGSKHRIPVLGLYPNTLNKVECTITDKKGNHYTKLLTFQTDSLPDYFPRIDLGVVQTEKMEPGFNLCGLSYGVQGKHESSPFVFDSNGDIRWYLNLRPLKHIVWPVERLKNGNFFFLNGSQVMEYDMLGEIINQWKVKGFNLHHDVTELPSGNFLAIADKHKTTIVHQGKEIGSSSDHVVEIDRETGDVVKEWDLRKVLDVDRNAIHEVGGDWMHLNGLCYSESDSCIIVSGKHQGIAKITQDNQLKWILAPHTGWGKAGRDGNGNETTPYLLTAVDKEGEICTRKIQTGTLESDSFNWSWGQHAPMLLPNGNLCVFDNGVNRNFGNAAYKYSRGVEYRINETDKTVEQIWAFGKKIGGVMYAFVVSDVDYLPQTKNRLIVSGRTFDSAKIFEVSYPDNEKIMEGTVIFKDALGDHSGGWGQVDRVFRAERLSLYPKSK